MFVFITLYIFRIFFNHFYNLTNYVNSIAKLRLSVCRSQKNPAAAQSMALCANLFTKYPASIALRKIQDRRAPSQVLPPGLRERRPTVTILMVYYIS